MPLSFANPQDFRKPFDSPAVLVVGHQTSGKSALIEALMGFQFNQVGGGTKTRRPIALRMQYNPECDVPRCWLTLENGREEPRTLGQIQVRRDAGKGGLYDSWSSPLLTFWTLVFPGLH